MKSVVQTLEVLNLQLPYEIVLLPKIELDNAVALYYGLLDEKEYCVSHRIEILFPAIKLGGRSLHSLIIHELIHAWQEEYYPNDKIHGKEFQRMANHLSKVTRVKNIYIKGTDI